MPRPELLEGQHFIANWQDRTIDTFPIPVHASDLERVFRSKRDAYIVAKWLTENKKHFTDFLYGEEDSYDCVISWAELKEFTSTFGNDGERD